MAKKKNYFTVGLFVLIGIVAGVVLIIWLGASRYFQAGKVYATYFDESVQGLQLDSAVKYRGVDIGIVDTIRLAPDFRLIEIVMRINYGGDIQNTIARLRMAGITGIVYVELDHKESGDFARAPKLTFTPEYPVIPSNPSDIKQIFSVLDSIMEQINQVDFKGISDELKTTARGLSAFMNGEEMKRIVTNVDSMAVNLEEAASKVNAMVTDGKIEAILEDTRESVKEARSVIGKIREEVNNSKIAETADKANRLIDNTNRRIKVITQDLLITSENLRRASENVDEVLDRLRADPSDIIFSSPPPKKR